MGLIAAPDTRPTMVELMNRHSADLVDKERSPQCGSQILVDTDMLTPLHEEAWRVFEEAHRSIARDTADRRKVSSEEREYHTLVIRPDDVRDWPNHPDSFMHMVIVSTPGKWEEEDPWDVMSPRRKRV